MALTKKIAYVQAAWHADITAHCKDAFTAELAARGYDRRCIDFYSAPGSLETEWTPDHQALLCYRRSRAPGHRCSRCVASVTATRTDATRSSTCRSASGKGSSWP